MDFQSKSMRMNNARRTATNYFISGLSILATVLVIIPLIAILFYLIYKGASSLNLAFFTHIPAPVGQEGSGMANAMVGSGIILFVASLMGVPIGIAAGVYPPEFGRGRRTTAIVQADVLSSVFNRDGHLYLLAHRDHQRLLCAGQRRRSRHHDGPDNHPDDRRCRNCAAHHP